MQLLRETIKTYAPMQHAAVDLEKDLPNKKEYSVNSWFTVSHFNCDGEKISLLYHDGEKISLLYHAMIVRIAKIFSLCTSCVSVTNESSRSYCQESKAFLLNRVEAPTDRFCIKTPINQLNGNLNEMNLKLYGKEIQLNAKLVPVGYPILNGGTGRFNMIGMDIFEYSLPTVETNGILTVKGKSYQICGKTWFDRQWENMNTSDVAWGWMDLNLSNGTYISLWYPVENRRERPFATILEPDGTQKVVRVDPVIATARDFWKSNVRSNDYPTKWTITIPDCDAKLEVVTEIKEQELQFKLVKQLNHYEAASTVCGMYEGQFVTGQCFVELLAMKPWSKVVEQLK